MGIETGFHFPGKPDGLLVPRLQGCKFLRQRVVIKRQTASPQDCCDACCSRSHGLGPKEEGRPKARGSSQKVPDDGIVRGRFAAVERLQLCLNALGEFAHIRGAEIELPVEVRKSLWWALLHAKQTVTFEAQMARRLQQSVDLAYQTFQARNQRSLAGKSVAKLCLVVSHFLIDL